MLALRRRPATALLTAIFVVLFGLAFGSFLNVCISRLPRHESIVHPGSRCPRCGAAIRSWDNVPLLSWVLLRGRCRECTWRIPLRYPAVEAATAVLFLLAWLQFGIGLLTIAIAVLCFLLLGLAVMDAETMRLPDAFTLPGIGLGVLYSGLLPAATAEGHLSHAGAAVLRALAAALVILAIRWLYYMARRVEGMGIGDAKLLAMIAAWLGTSLTVLTLFVGTVSAAVFGVVWVALARQKGRSLTSRLPFGSFLCAGAIFAVFAGQPLITWYMQFFP